ncbi:MAG TPA: hypothetical protein VFB43_14410 [Terracidiphilus sp.]|nr:hypothetical protein [Terracidiphilus sp.]
MKALPGFLLLALSFSLLSAQQPQILPDQAQNQEQNGVPTVTMHDGGVDQVLQSIYVPPILNAPFTAIVHTEWIRSLSDGGTFTVVNQRQIARDSTGRLYEERWLLVPKGGKVKSLMNVIQIADPSAHTLCNCFLLRKPRQCVIENYRASATAVYRPSQEQNSPLPNGDGFRTHEDLGIQDISGIATVGTRDTTTINQGVFGNDRPYNMIRESWFASSLGINLKSEITNPSFGKEVFTLTDVSQSAPDPKLFEIPEGFEIVDHRKSAPPAE